MSTFSIPKGKYNPWCYRRPLVKQDNQTDIVSIFSRKIDKSLSLYERAAFFMHEVARCEGIEFVVISNVRFTKRVEFLDEIILVPCFLPDLNNRSWNDPLVRATSGISWILFC